MSRFTKILSVSVVVLFVLACNFVTQPVKDVQNLAGTAQSIVTSVPIETIQALPSAIASVIPAETLEALPSVGPTIEAFATVVGDMLNPQGTPAQEWRGIPIMPQATAGQEFSEGKIYSFKATATGQEVQDFYSEKLKTLGWNQLGGAAGVFLTFQKDANTLAITITASDGSAVVLLTMAP